MTKTSTHAHTNHLIESTSPYLLQHAHNPVDWRPWGPEAFTEARERGVPILLSIGYSTCYWCHVMERESFEDEATAREMNASFVCIKVDREERPDVDELAMTATQIMTSSGGWPLNVFLEPDQLRPFWCGTYFPGTPAHGRPSFRQVLEGMRTAWADQREEVLEQAKSLAGAVAEVLGSRDAPVRLGSATIEEAVADLLRMHDRTHGGFGAAPKFPQPLGLDLLLDARNVADEHTRSSIDAAISHTLDRMALGGIHDHVGGGFHRYAVDAHWTVPHFEKMLYDNALLAATYTRAASVYVRDDWARVARRTLEYVRREMRSAGETNAGFWSAQDAEVQGREGLNYLWTPEQVEAVLNDAGLGEHAATVLETYGLSRGTNFQDPHHPGDAPTNVLRLDAVPAEDLQRILDQANPALLAARDQREQPHTDDKVLAVWNGLMIDAMSGFAHARPDDPDAGANRDAAAGALQFLQSTLQTEDGRLLRAARAGKAHTDAFLDDHGAVARAMVSIGAIDAAAALVQRAIEHFTERDSTGAITAIYDTRADQPDLFTRTLSVQDGATPSGVGLLIHACLDLHEANAEAPGGRAWLDAAAQLLHVVSGRVARSPAGSANTVRALLRALRLGVTLPDAPESDASPTPADFTPIQVFASTDRVSLTEAAPAAEFELAIRIHPEHHLIAADPGATDDNRALVAGLVPFRVTVVGGSGVAVYADYPAGDAFDGLPAADGDAAASPERTVKVYTGEHQLTVVLERTGPITGTPIIVVAYQACTDRACLAPGAVELDVAIDAD